MKVYGLTGGIGMGKTTSEKLLRGRGVPVVDTDFLARQIVEPGQPALGEIKEVFGPEMIGPDGHLRRRGLAKLVFDDTTKRKRLEGILHPRIRRLWQEQIEQWRVEGLPLGVVIIPLLFETGAARNFDVTVCVACSAASQNERLQARGWSSDEIEKRLRAQWAVEQKMELANRVVWTEGSLEVHAEQLRRIIPGR